MAVGRLKTRLVSSQPRMGFLKIKNFTEPLRLNCNRGGRMLSGSPAQPRRLARLNSNSGPRPLRCMGEQRASYISTSSNHSVTVCGDYLCGKHLSGLMSIDPQVIPSCPLVFDKPGCLNGCNGEHTNSDDREPDASRPPEREPDRIAGEHFHNVTPGVFVALVFMFRVDVPHVTLLVFRGAEIVSERRYNRQQTVDLIDRLVQLGLGEEIPGSVAFLNGINGEATNSDDIDMSVLFDTRVSHPSRDLEISSIVSGPRRNRADSVRSWIPVISRTKKKDSVDELPRPSPKPKVQEPVKTQFRSFKSALEQTSPVTHKAKTGAHERVAQNKRLAREAETTRHSANPGKGGKTLHGPTPEMLQMAQEFELKNLLPDQSDHVTDDSTPKHRPAQVITTYYVPDEFGEWFYDGDEYYTVPFGPPVPDITMCRDQGPGWVKVSSWAEMNKTQVVLVPAFSSVTVDGYYRRDQNGVDQHFAERTYRVCEPFLRLCRKQLPSSVVDESLLKGCCALATRSLVPDSWGESTVEFYIAVIHRRGSTLMGKSSFMEKVANNGCIVATGDFGRVDETVKLGVDMNLFTPLYVEDIECAHVEFEVRDDFRVLKDTGNVVADNGRIMFTAPGVLPKKRGITKMFSCRGKYQDGFVEYADSANNMNQGLKRLIGARVNEDLYRRNACLLGAVMAQHSSPMCAGAVKDMYEELNNGRYGGPGDKPDDPLTPTRTFIAKSIHQVVAGCNRTTIQKFLDKTRTAGSWLYYKIYEQILTAAHPLISRDAAANIVHVKRKLRREYVNGRRLHTDDDLMVTRMQACIKRELAKFGKPPRLFVQYGAGAMYANELPEFVKLCIDGLHVFHENGRTMAMYLMSKPRDGKMDELFKNLKEAMAVPNFIQVIIFSDDSCVAGRDSEGSFGLNVDISANDSSQDVPAFLSVFEAMHNFHGARAEGLIRQCMLPLDIVNPQNKDERVRILFRGPIEGSGTILTAILNFFANACNYLGAFHLWAHGTDIKTAIVKGAEIVGHQVTLEPWGESGVCLNKAQFLKRSPVQIDGKWVTQVNLGCILRSLGSVDDELVATQLGWPQSKFLASTMAQRMEAFFSAVIGGWVNESSNSIMDALRERFSSSFTEVIEHDSLKNVFTEDRVVRNGKSDDGLFNRYGLNQDEIDEAVSLIKNLQLGMHVSCAAFAKIYHVDYGVPLPLGMTVN